MIEFVFVIKLYQGLIGHQRQDRPLFLPKMAKSIDFFTGSRFLVSAGLMKIEGTDELKTTPLTDRWLNFPPDATEQFLYSSSPLL